MADSSGGGGFGDGHLWVDRGTGSASTSGEVHEAGVQRVWGKKVISAPYSTWGLANKFKTAFPPGAPVTLRGKVAQRAGGWQWPACWLSWTVLSSLSAEPQMLACSQKRLGPSTGRGHHGISKEFVPKAPVHCPEKMGLICVSVSGQAAPGSWRARAQSSWSPTRARRPRPRGLEAVYTQRPPLKKGAFPGLAAKALAAVEAAVPDLDAADVLPAQLRAQQGFMPWLQVTSAAASCACTWIACATELRALDSPPISFLFLWMRAA